MGTPDFAVPGLQILVENGYKVVAVITAPDRPSGRGLKLAGSPVKQYAESQGLTVLQPEKLKDKAFLDTLAQLKADLQVVIAFRMLPEVVWNMPTLGTFNLHASLLPQYRGAAPINWAVINGERKTGITTFFIEKEIDTGKIIFQEEEQIHEEDTAGTLYERLMYKGAGLVLKTVQAIEAGNYPSTSQHFSEEPKEAPKIFKETCQIDWQESSEKIHDFIRGLAPYPAAWTTINGLSAKIYKSRVAQEFEGEFAAPGEYQSDGKKYLIFRTGNGWLAIEELQLEGRKKMAIDELLRGWKV